MTGAELIAKERVRQIEEEGWTKEHDSSHHEGDLVMAAVCYASPDTELYYIEGDGTEVPVGWPWDVAWWKPSGDRVKDLTKAGALIAAEIDKINNSKKGL